MGADHPRAFHDWNNRDLIDQTMGWLAFPHIEGRTYLEKEKLPGPPTSERLVKAAEDELRRRKLRARYLPAELFGEGAWSMLLDLFVCQYRGRTVSTKGACIAADVPATTALRWLDVLESKGLVQRTSVAGDKRVKYVSLTTEAHNALCALLSRQIG